MNAGFFYDGDWIKQNGLTIQSIMEYFSLSPFYDRSCNNEILKMQTKYSDMKTLAENLNQMVGLQFSFVETKDPDLFLVRKVYRKTPSEYDLQMIYYIVYGTIYPGQNIKRIFETYMTHILRRVSGIVEKSLEIKKFFLFRGDIFEIPQDEYVHTEDIIERDRDREVLEKIVRRLFPEKN